jgi:hypothetical protein
MLQSTVRGLQSNFLNGSFRAIVLNLPGKFSRCLTAKLSPIPGEHKKGLNHRLSPFLDRSETAKFYLLSQASPMPLPLQKITTRDMACDRFCLVIFYAIFIASNLSFQYQNVRIYFVQGTSVISMGISFAVPSPSVSGS